MQFCSLSIADTKDLKAHFTIRQLAFAVRPRRLQRRKWAWPGKPQPALSVNQAAAGGMVKIAHFGAILGPVTNLWSESMVLLFAGPKHEIRKPKHKVSDKWNRGASLPWSSMAQFVGELLSRSILTRFPKSEAQY